MKQKIEIVIDGKTFQMRVGVFGRELDVKIESPQQTKPDATLWVKVATALSDKLGIRTVKEIDSLAVDINWVGDTFDSAITYQMRDSPLAVVLNTKFGRPGSNRLKIYFEHEPSELEIAVALHREAALLTIFSQRKAMFT